MEKLEKKLSALNKSLATEIAYNEDAKKSFKNSSTAFLKELASLLNLKESKVTFNAGGVAVSGDATLMGMWEESKGIYVTISQTIFGSPIMYRTISHMKDYTGGQNNFVSESTMEREDGGSRILNGIQSLYKLLS